MILAIDPGPRFSAYVVWEGKIVSHLKARNEHVVEMCESISGFDNARLVIEKIASYGMAVGAEVFETCVWTGRFMQAFGADRVDRITRIEIKSHLCHSAQANDSNIRQALIDRIGPPGTKKNPGPTFGIAGDCWSALAVAVTWSDSPEYWMQRTKNESEGQG